MLRLFLAFALAVLSAPALAQDNAAAPLPLPTTKFTFNPTAQQNYWWAESAGRDWLTR